MASAGLRVIRRVGPDDQPGGQPIRDHKPLLEVAQRQTITADQPLYKCLSDEMLNHVSRL